MTVRRHLSSRYFRPKLYFGLTPLYWVGTITIAGVLVAIVCCLLTCEIPI